MDGPGASCIWGLQNRPVPSIGDELSKSSYWTPQAYMYRGWYRSATIYCGPWTKCWLKPAMCDYSKHWKTRKSEDPNRALQKKENEDSLRKVHEWKGVQVKHRLEPQPHKFIQMMTIVPSWRDGQQGRTIVTKQGIELTSRETRSFQFGPNRAGPRVREFEQAKIDKTWKWELLDWPRHNGPLS